MRSRSSRRTMADTADPYALYQQSVQNPEADIAFIERAFRGRYSRSPRVLHEDFCGTAFLACGWAASRPDRRAVAFDVDPVPLAWGAAHNRAALADEDAARVELVQGDVRTVAGPPADVVVAGNFSFCVFGKRAELLEYLVAARARLAEEGILVLDVVGGPSTQREKHETTRPELSFEYVWEQRSFDPVSYRAEFAIHFRFVDQSELRDAFVYDWRLWTLPELHDLLETAGFSDVTVYWEQSDAKTGRGNGVFRPVGRAPADDSWLAQVVAIR